MKTLIFFLCLFSVVCFGQTNGDTFQNVPPLNRKEAKIYLQAIQQYVIQYPDSLRGIYSKLDSLDLFIKSTTGDSLRSIKVPKKVIDNIEKNNYNGDILTWRPEKDNQYIMYDSFRKTIKDFEERIAILKAVQCKYFKFYNIPCPY